MLARPAASRQAFTLVELLLVVSIIGLLVTLLIPSLRQAREQGRRAVCGVHLRGLDTSWEVYTLEYDSPPHLARRGVDINWTCADDFTLHCERYVRVPVAGFGPDTFETYATASNDNQVWLSALHFRNKLFQVSNPPPPGPLPGHWWNWGLMWLSGMVESPRVFFCPSMRNPLFAWDTPLNPWPPSVETMWRPDNPRKVNHTESSYERRAGLSGVPWDLIPPQTTIAHDIGAPNIEGVDEPAHRDGANVVYRDGHVTYVRSTFFKTWWGDADTWLQTEVRERFLAYQYWMDTEGRWTPPAP